MNVHFNFSGHMHRQIVGIAMCSPLGPILFDIFLAKRENDPLAQIDKFSFCCRYMNDTFVFCKDCTGLIETLERFNKIHLSTNFACDEENGVKVAFPDVLFTKRKDRSLGRNINKKST